MFRNSLITTSLLFITQAYASQLNPVLQLKFEELQKNFPSKIKPKEFNDRSKVNNKTLSNRIFITKNQDAILLLGEKIRDTFFFRIDGALVNLTKYGHFAHNADEFIPTKSYKRGILINESIIIKSLMYSFQETLINLDYHKPSGKTLAYHFSPDSIGIFIQDCANTEDIYMLTNSTLKTIKNDLNATNDKDLTLIYPQYSKYENYIFILFMDNKKKNYYLYVLSQDALNPNIESNQIGYKNVAVKANKLKLVNKNKMVRLNPSLDVFVKKQKRGPQILEINLETNSFSVVSLNFSQKLCDAVIVHKN